MASSIVVSAVQVMADLRLINRVATTRGPKPPGSAGFGSHRRSAWV